MTLRQLLRNLSVLTIALFCTAPFALAQNDEYHAQVGAFINYFRLSHTDTSFWGIGGRLSGNAGRHFQLEGEMSYDFDRRLGEDFTNASCITITSCSSPGNFVFRRTGVRIL